MAQEKGKFISYCYHGCGAMGLSNGEFINDFGNQCRNNGGNEHDYISVYAKRHTRSRSNLTRPQQINNIYGASNASSNFYGSSNNIYNYRPQYNTPMIPTSNNGSRSQNTVHRYNNYQGASNHPYYQNDNNSASKTTKTTSKINTIDTADNNGYDYDSDTTQYYHRNDRNDRNECFNDKLSKTETYLQRYQKLMVLFGDDEHLLSLCRKYEDVNIIVDQMDHHNTECKETPRDQQRKSYDRDIKVNECYNTLKDYFPNENKQYLLKVSKIYKEEVECAVNQILNEDLADLTLNAEPHDDNLCVKCNKISCNAYGRCNN